MLFMSYVFMLSHAFMLSSVHCCPVVTCWERADLLAIACGVSLCFLSLSHVVSWVRCGTLLYLFLVFAAFLTLALSCSGPGIFDSGVQAQLAEKISDVFFSPQLILHRGSNGLF